MRKYRDGKLRKLGFIVAIVVVALAMVVEFAMAAETDAFPDTGSPQLYDPEQEESPKATAPDADRGMSPGNQVEDIEEFEELVERGERSSLFDGFLMISGGLLFFYAALLILVYGLDRVSIIPNFSLLKLVTFGKYDIYGISIGQFLLRDSALLIAGILLGSGAAKKLITLVLIAVQSILT